MLNFAHNSTEHVRGPMPAVLSSYYEQVALAMLVVFISLVTSVQGADALNLSILQFHLDPFGRREVFTIYTIIIHGKVTMRNFFQVDYKYRVRSYTSRNLRFMHTLLCGTLSATQTSKTFCNASPCLARV